VIQNEEERFLRPRFRTKDLTRGDGSAKEREEDPFRRSGLFVPYDTFGFPLDLTADILQEEGMGFDEEGFKAQMEEQRLKSKQAWQGMGEGKTREIYRRFVGEGVQTHFIGYEETQSDSKILKLIKGDEVVPLPER
jgi:alanyl-tRNA synthetase